MTEKEKSRREIEREIDIIVAAMAACKSVMKDTFGKLWTLMHKEPFITQRRLLQKTEEGRKERKDITDALTASIMAVMTRHSKEAIRVIDKDYDEEPQIQDAEKYAKRYSGKFTDIAEAFIIAAILTDEKNEANVWLQMMANKNTPLTASVFRDKRVSESTKQAIIIPLITGTGSGNYISPFADFDRLTKYTIHKAFSDAKVTDMADRGYGWYRCFRNSNYDCPACDDVCAVPHRITETVLPVHPNCVCGMYPIDENEL